MQPNVLWEPRLTCSLPGLGVTAQSGPNREPRVTDCLQPEPSHGWLDWVRSNSFSLTLASSHRCHLVLIYSFSFHPWLYILLTLCSESDFPDYYWLPCLYLVPLSCQCTGAPDQSMMSLSFCMLNRQSHVGGMFSMVLILWQWFSLYLPARFHVACHFHRGCCLWSRQKPEMLGIHVRLYKNFSVMCEKGCLTSWQLIQVSRANCVSPQCMKWWPTTTAMEQILSGEWNRKPIKVSNVLVCI